MEILDFILVFDQNLFSQVRMTTPPTQCGRPGFDDIGKFARYLGNTSPIYYGDPNYGVVINDDSQVPSNPSGFLGSPIQGIPEGWYQGTSGCAGSGVLECPVVGDTPGCAYPGIPAGCTMTYSALSGSPVFFPGAWKQHQNPASILSCCTDQESNSSACAPDQCSDSPSGCQNAMKNLCLNSTQGPNALWEEPAPGFNGACDLYASSTAGVPYGPSGSTTTAGADFISAAVGNYFQYGGKVTDDTYFASKIPGLCAQYPGLCDSYLKSQCSALTLDQLNPELWKGRTYDSQGTIPLQACGCFLPPSQYAANFPIECQSSCAFPGAVPIGSGNPGQPAKQCQATECVIDNVTADYINSTGGNISIKQVCGQCSPDQPCACYFSNISVTGVDDPSISVNCQNCYNYDPSTGLAAQVECPGGGAGSGGTSKIFWWILGGVVGLLVLYFFWRVANRNFS